MRRFSCFRYHVVYVYAVLLPAALVLTSACTAQAPSGATTPTGEDFSVLVFSKTEGYRHASIADGIAALRDLGTAHGFTVDAIEDAATFRDTTLAAYAVVVFLSTSGNVLDADAEAALQGFVQSGGGFVGIHAASDTEYDWPWYGSLVGAYFDSHPEEQTATVVVADTTHPSTADLPVRWERFDEWYNFQAPPEGVRVLARLEETSYDGGTMGADHPIAWSHHFDGGRAWYTAGGHTSESYAEPLFRAHLVGGILWAAGRADG